MFVVTFFFFFQAEDGIRDSPVTGVQTCALPIYNLASDLSGGQSKLVDIGRALMSSPSFLLLDEPVAGVAGHLAEKIFQNLRTLTSCEGIGMLVIEHNMEFILRRDVDRIIVMNGGQILLEGTPDEIRHNRDVVEAYLGNAGQS